MNGNHINIIFKSELKNVFTLQYNA